MYQFEKDALVKKIAERKREKPRKPLALLAREMIRGSGITNPSDVKRFAQEFCEILGQHGQSAQAAARMRAKQNRRAEV